ncbi:MAG: glycoside hydrolase family 2 protein [Eubacteriales bacterium]|nr:glycoside hydrolase family 2 protein [Eubacteriales bacterium]
MDHGRISLNGAWEMRPADEAAWMPATVPGSVYADLMDNGRMEDPFWRDNEMKAFPLMEKDYCYRRHFTLTAEELACDRLLLICEGLDTLATVRLNGVTVLEADNMHRRWEVDALPLVREGENLIEVDFASPVNFMRREYARSRVDGSTDCVRGFPFLRKAHCMSGWDWGPRLPDAGIWRDIYLQPVRSGRLISVRVHQAHEDGRVTLHFFPEAEVCGDAACTVRCTVTAPDGTVLTTEGDSLVIDHPQLWWPNGYGAQPLYTVLAELVCEGETVDTWQRRIGLRTMTMRREKDQWGESFETCVNGVSIFAMGADYIPEDNILRRVTPERTRRLLADAAAAHHNAIRVWGGGYYPDDWFYDACDELGLVVWQDFMFACAMYELTPAFEANIRAEAEDNVRRLRHHASLGLWSGNNEMEIGVVENWYDQTPRQVTDYVKMYEYILPQVLFSTDPDACYWPASPSSGGSFDNPNDPNRGDVHYWQVWHGNKPFTDYRNHFFRYASEFGFQSFPCRKTIESFTLPEDRNIFSYVMEKHQRNGSANGKIMNYLAQTFLYPGTFDHLLYASQLMQMEAIRYGVEHWRRNRGRCMGAIYWQLNDCWPVTSWASIDYFGRWKALHYASRRFFAPVLLSCEEEGALSQLPNLNAEPGFTVEKSIRLNVSNETREAVTARVVWSLRDPMARVLASGEDTVTVDALSARWLPKHDFPDADLYGSYAAYELWMGGEQVSSGTALFCAPKHFRFADPQLRLTVEQDAVVVTASAYARSVEIVCEDGDVVLEDNYFDLNAESRRVRILRGEGRVFTVRSVYDIGRDRS